MADQLSATDRPLEATNGNSNNKRKHEDDDPLADQNEKNLDLEQSYVTMIDVLNEEEKLEEDAYAVLGGSDDKNCTYEQGYITRQALYSCRTCMGDNPKLDEDVFGICLACSYACHADHDLFELYTKRAFRCDCGTGKMKKGKCTLNAEKEPTNDENKYNHNFIGKYCICAQPYPNPEGKDEEMVQCVVCEDWFHENCLECRFPDDEDYAEMICKSCMQSNQFLWYYQAEKVRTRSQTNGAAKVADVEAVKKEEEIKAADSTEIKAEEIKNEAGEQPKPDEKQEEPVKSDEKPEDLPKESSAEPVNTGASSNSAESHITTTNGDHKANGSGQAAEPNECKLTAFKTKLNIDLDKNGTTFWDEGWRSQLCKCNDCLAMYARNRVEFLTNENDTVHSYEAKGKEKCQKISQYEQGLNEISKMGHVVSIDAITGEFLFRSVWISIPVFTNGLQISV